MQIRLKLIQSTVTRARADVKRRMSAARGAMQQQLRRECLLVLRERNRICAVATGETQDAGHVIPAQQTSRTFTTGMGIARLRNGQEIRVESGEIEPHTHAHDLKGRVCSSGYFFYGGTWDDPEETNVRARRGLRGVNPSAVLSPLATAIEAVHGQIADTDARFQFEKGRLNVFPPAQIKGDDKLRPRLKAAADGALK